MAEYRAVIVDGVSIPTTNEGALAVEKLQTQLRDAQALVDGLQGQVDALVSTRPSASPVGDVATLADSRLAAADAHAKMTQRLRGGWQRPANGG